MSRPLSAPYPIAAAPAYHRHRPEQTELYSIINEHYPRFVEEFESSGGHLPGFVRQEFEDYLKCGLLERLCRYIARPPIATKRLSVDGRGRVVCRYKQPFRDGSTHLVLEPLDFMARLAALVPRPRLNLTRFHGVFAPNFKHRKRIVPRRPELLIKD